MTLDAEKARALVDTVWDESIVPTLVEYIEIPNKSPMFDAKWREHGHMDKAVELIAKHLGMFIERREVTGNVGIVFDMKFGDGLRSINGDPVRQVIDNAPAAELLVDDKESTPTKPTG